METITSIKPLLAVLVSLTGAFLILLTGERARNIREFWTILASIIKFIIVLSMLPSILEGKVLEYTIISSGPSLGFKVDSLGVLFGLVASFLWIITSFYSIGYMRALNEYNQTRYYACFAICLSSAMGLAFSANLLTTFMFYEIITLSTYPLVAHKQTKEAINSGRKYLIYLLGTSMAFQLLAILLTYNIAQTLNFSNCGIIAREGVSNTLLILIFVFFILGITKAAMMPLHSWLPSAMVAPVPVSALLHAVVVVNAGVFVVIKVVLHIFGIELLKSLGLGLFLAYFASFTIIFASIMALKQDDLKRRLAYSTVSQLSYIIVGASILTPLAITGSIMHIILHAFSKITLFFVAGAIYIATGKTKISEMNGIGKKMPLVMAAFTLGALSVIGIPPLSGFLSKWYIALGAAEGGQVLIVFVLAISTILNAFYFIPIIYNAFFKKPSDGLCITPTNLQNFIILPLVLTAIGTIVLFFTPSIFLELARMAAEGAMEGR